VLIEQLTLNLEKEQAEASGNGEASWAAYAASPVEVSGV